MVVKYPFSEELVSENVYRRTFAEGVDDDELIWHRDHEHRVITVVESSGWKLQAEDKLPVDLTPGVQVTIKAEEWHRVIKGEGDLVVEVHKKPLMKIKLGQLKTLVREIELNEGLRDWLTTATKYYADLSVRPNPQEKFKKDLKSSGVDEMLDWASAIPVIGLAPGLASVALKVAAGDTKGATLSLAIMAAAQVGGGAAVKGGQAGLAKLLRSQGSKIQQIIISTADKIAAAAQKIPGLGGKIQSGINTVKSQADEALEEIASWKTEDILAHATEDKKAQNKIAKIQQSKAGKEAAKVLSEHIMRADLRSLIREEIKKNLKRRPSGWLPATEKNLNLDKPFTADSWITNQTGVPVNVLVKNYLKGMGLLEDDEEEDE
jgi:hypothetical protein